MLMILLFELFSFFHKKTRIESHKKVCQNKDFCNIVKPPEDTKILEFNQYQKSDKARFTIYANHKSLIEKINECRDNPEKSSAIKVGEHLQSSFSMSAASSFKSIENKRDIYRDKYCLKKCCESLTQPAHDVPRTYPQGPLKVLTSGTSRGPSGDS